MVFMTDRSESDFARYRQHGNYYVDKTGLVEDIFREEDSVVLFTRPRRFGKSMNLSMLDAFFNIDGSGEGLFDDLYISSVPGCMEHMGRHPVIYMDFKDCAGDTFEKVFSKMTFRIAEVFRDHSELLDSDALDSVERELFEDCMRGRMDDGELELSLAFLSKVLHEHHGEEVVVLIDEYDSILNNVYDTGAFERTLAFIKGLLTPLFKNNSHLFKGIMTGVMQIPKGSMFSGLNNIRVDNILSVSSHERFGFTDDEVEGMCVAYVSDHPDVDPAWLKSTIKEWYDGYRFGDAEVYNPWSVISFLRYMEPKAYWVNTASPYVLTQMVSLVDQESRVRMEALLSGESVRIPMEFDICYGVLKHSSDNLFTVLLMAGYLTSDGDDMVRIPNHEVMFAYRTLFRTLVGNEAYGAVMGFSKAIESGDPEEASRHLEGFLMDNFPGNTVGGGAAFRNVVAMMLIVTSRSYSCRVEVPAGKGVADIIMYPKSPELPNVVIETKHTSRRDMGLLRLSKVSLRQIRKKCYTYGLEGRTFIYGVSAGSTGASVEMEVLDLRRIIP